MNTRIGMAFILALALGAARAEEKKAETSGATQAPKKQTVCPVMGGAVNTNLYADADGKRIYFCCSSCVEKFKKDPAPYLAKLEKEGVTPEKAPSEKAPSK